LALAGCLALILSACGLPRGILVQQGSSGQTSSTPSSNNGGPVSAFAPQAAAFVAQHSGLKFKHPVRVVGLSAAAFPQRAAAIVRRDRANTQRLGNLFRGLGLVAPGVDLEKEQELAVSRGVIGIYDTVNDQVLVKGTTATLSIRHTIVHELTEAILAQNYGTRLLRQSNQDAALAYQALIQGDAIRIETEYVDGLSSSDRSLLQKEDQASQSQVPAGVPQVLVDELNFPYEAGPTFVAALLQTGGTQAIAQAFKHPPSSTNQVLHPDRYLSGAMPVSLPDPSAPAPVSDRGTIGEYNLDLMFAGAISAGALSETQVLAATGSWAGDSYVVWSQGGQECVRDDVATQTAAGATALVTALQSWASTRPGATVQSTPVISFSSCG
jgi:hypothetical protein